MNAFDAMKLRRSIRKFRPEPVSCSDLKEILEAARLYPSGGNLQPLRFAVLTRPAYTDTLFADLKWAMYLPGYAIAPQERPTAYIVLLRDDNISRNCRYDVGAASTMIMLGATAKGLASCAIGNFSSQKLSQLLQLPENLQPELVIALGYPDQESFPVPMEDTIRYRQDENGNFLVPKWSAEQITVFTDWEETV